MNWFRDFRAQMHLLTHWWKHEMGLMAAMPFGEVTGAATQWGDEHLRGR